MSNLLVEFTYKAAINLDQTISEDALDKFAKNVPIYGVLVTYNRLKALKGTIERCESFGFDELLIVDNASTDGTQSYLEQLTSSRIKIIRLPRNVGGAGGFKAGVQYFNESGHNGWVCLFDDDSYPISTKEEVQAELAAVPEKTGVVAAAVFLPNGEISEMNRVAQNPFKSGKVLLNAIINGRDGFHIKDEDYRGAVIPIDTASFVGCFIHTRTLREINLLPREDFFIYGDDVLFTYEISEKGYQNIFNPKIVFEHDCSAFDERRVYVPIWKVYFLYRNGLEVYEKVSKVFFPLVFAKCIVEWALRGRHYGEKKKIYYSLFKLGVSDYFKGNFQRSLPDILSHIKAIETR